MAGTSEREAAKLRLLIVGNGRKPGVRAAVKDLRPWIRQRAEIVGEDLDERLDLRSVEADLALIFGGDGSMLSTVRRLGANPVPVLGINFGKLGFLTELSYPGMRRDLDTALRGRFVVREWMRLDVSIHRGRRTIGRSLVVNEATLMRSDSRMITMELLYGGETVTTYYADGLIVATPIGSTAYSLAAGGPIVQPGLEALVFTPICSHTLTNRPLVVASSVPVVIRLLEVAEEVHVISDGQEQVAAREGDEVRLVSSDKKFHLAQLGKTSYFERLNTKLFWGRSGRVPSQTKRR
jgi:NAD+ kinase